MMLDLAERASNRPSSPELELSSRPTNDGGGLVVLEDQSNEGGTRLPVHCHREAIPPAGHAAKDPVRSEGLAPYGEEVSQRLGLSRFDVHGSALAVRVDGSHDGTGDANARGDPDGLTVHRNGQGRMDVLSRRTGK